MGHSLSTTQICSTDVLFSACMEFSNLFNELPTFGQIGKFHIEIYLSGFCFQSSQTKQEVSPPKKGKTPNKPPDLNFS